MRGLPLQPLLDDLDADNSELSRRARLVLEEIQNELDEAHDLLHEFLDGCEDDRIWVMTGDGLRERAADLLGRDLP